MRVSITLDKEKFEKEKEKFIEKNKKISGEEDAYWIESDASIEEFYIDDDENLFISLQFGSEREHYVSIEVPLKVRDVKHLLKELMRIASQLGASSIVKEAKESGTGAVVYVPKEWKGKKIAVMKK